MLTRDFFIAMLKSWPKEGQVMIDKLLIAQTFRQLAMMIDAGLPLVDALKICSDNNNNKTLADALNDIRAAIQKGTPFGEASALHPSLFTEYQIALIKAGEMGGILDTVLNRLATYAEKDMDFENQLEKSLVKKFKSNLAWLKDQLRANVDNIVFDRLILEMPHIGKLLMLVEMTRYCRMLGTLVACGVSILDALDITSNLTENTALKAELYEISVAVSEGKSIGETMKKSKLIPPLFGQMIRVGESTGGLDVMLAKLADYSEQEIEILMRESF